MDYLIFARDERGQPRDVIETACARTAWRYYHQFERMARTGRDHYASVALHVGTNPHRLLASWRAATGAVRGSARA